MKSKPVPPYFFALLVLGTISVDCTLSDPATDTPVAKEPSIGESMQPETGPTTPTLAVLQTGEEPRTRLRYRFQHHTESMMLSFWQEAAIMGMTQIMPKTKLTIRIVEEKNNPEDLANVANNILAGVLPPTQEIHSARIHYKVTRTKVSPRLGVTGVVLATAKQAAARASQSSASFVLTNRGAISQKKFSGIDNNPSSAINQFDKLITLLPTQTMGKGGQWQTQQQLISRGILVDQTTQYTIKKLTKKAVTLQATINQTAQKQTIPLAMGTEQTALLTSFDGQGTGTLRIVFSKRSPKAKISMVTNMSVIVAGKPVTMTSQSTIQTQPL